MSRLYAPPVLTPRQSPETTILQNSSPVSLRNSSTSLRPTIYNQNAYRQYLTRQTFEQPRRIRGQELFIRSIRRIIEQIRDKKQRRPNDKQLLSSYEDAINLFNDLTFMKCVLLKKKLSDPKNCTWTIEFAQQGGLHALLSYLEHITTKSLSLVDAILVNETLQCLRALMNISELFEHIASNPQYIDSIAKVLSVPSVEVRMRVFELLTALCVYSQDGYELVLHALQDFQTNQKLSNVFVVILEQLKFAVIPKHKWSAIALLNSILSSTESMEKRISYRNILYSNGILSILEQARVDGDEDLNLQIEIFFEEQKHDEEQFLGHFDPSDNQAVCQAIQLQLAAESNDSALFLTAMQVLYSILTSTNSIERQKVLQGLLEYVSHATEPIPEKKTFEKSAQTDVIPQFETQTSPSHQQVPTVQTSTPTLTNGTSNETEPASVLINTEKSTAAQPLLTQPSAPKLPPPPPPPLPADLQTISSDAPPPPPPPPLPVDMQTDGSRIPPPPPLPPSSTGGVPPPPPPPPPGFPGAPPLPPGFSGAPPPPPPPGFPGAPSPAQFGNKQTIVGLSALVDNIPKPKGKVRRLQWKKLPQTILTTSQFWKDVNNNVDTQINFSELEDFFKVNTENTATTVAAKPKSTTILPCNRSIAINVFLKKFNFTDAQSFVATLQDAKSDLNSECLRMLIKVLPSGDEINLIRDHPREQWALPEEFIHEVGSLSYHEFRVQTRLLITEFDETFDDFKRKFQHVTRVINFLEKDTSIKQLARSLLSVGDFLNYGSYAGNAFGFRLDILNQLHDMRSSENRTLLGVLLERSPQNFKFIDDLKPMLAHDIQIKSVKIEYLQWKKKIDDGLKQINSIEDQQVIGQFKPFYENSSQKLNNNLDPILNECENKEKDLMKQFGETDLNEFNYDTCCTIFRQLIDQVEKENKEREKRLAAATTKALVNTTKLVMHKTEPIMKSSDNNFMDSLMTELKQKKFATTPARRQRARPGLLDFTDREIK